MVAVKVYRNRHKSAWSVVVSGKVSRYADSLLLKDCKFRVQPAGHQRYLRDKVRNVHAYVQGRLTELEDGSKQDGKWLKAWYRKDLGAFTLDGDNCPLLKAALVRFHEDGGISVRH